jgi:hypothetical protein
LAEPDTIETDQPVAAEPGAYTGAEVVYPYRLEIAPIDEGHTKAWATSVGPHGHGLLVHDQVTLTDVGPVGMGVGVGVGAGGAALTE